MSDNKNKPRVLYSVTDEVARLEIRNATGLNYGGLLFGNTSLLSRDNYYVDGESKWHCPKTATVTWGGSDIADDQFDKVDWKTHREQIEKINNSCVINLTSETGGVKYLSSIELVNLIESKGVYVDQNGYSALTVETSRGTIGSYIWSVSIRNSYVIVDNIGGATALAGLLVPSTNGLGLDINFSFANFVFTITAKDYLRTDKAFS